ncbi:unnamed protein product, partial [marine sediment metagenome]
MDSRDLEVKALEAANIAIKLATTETEVIELGESFSCFKDELADLVNKRRWELYNIGLASAIE